MAVLIGVSPDVKGKNLNLDKSPFTIGGASDNVLPLSIPGVSGHHCEIVTEGTTFKLRDLGSTNGTRINGRDITEHTLRSGEVIAVGTVEFLFNDGSEATDAGTDAQVVEDAGGGKKPVGFDSISPFGPRRREATGRLTTVLVILGIVAVCAIGFVLYKLFME
jgi:pSer/pThr/pTyr-binding forkhead associated (FHA) protein